MPHRASNVFMVATTLCETIKERGDNGAPLTIIYSALRGVISYNSFMEVIKALEKRGAIEVRLNVAYAIRGPALTCPRDFGPAIT